MVASILALWESLQTPTLLWVASHWCTLNQYPESWWALILLPITAMKLSLHKMANGAIISKRQLFSSQGFDTKPAIVSIVVCLPWCRGSPGTHLVTTLHRNIPKFYTHIKWWCITTQDETEKKVSCRDSPHSAESPRITFFFCLIWEVGQNLSFYMFFFYIKTQIHTKLQRWCHFLSFVQL